MIFIEDGGNLHMKLLNSIELNFFHYDMEGQTDVSCVIELIGQNFLCKKFQMAVDFFLVRQ